LKIEDLKSKWSDGGILTIEAPLPKAPDWTMKTIAAKEPEKEIKIIHHTETPAAAQKEPEIPKVAPKK
jgi:hypothetical protein